MNVLTNTTIADLSGTLMGVTNSSLTTGPSVISAAKPVMPPEKMSKLDESI